MDRIINDSAKKELDEAFKNLADDVTLMAFTKDGENEPYNEVLLQLMGELGELTPKIKGVTHKAGSKEASKYNVSHFPTLLISPERYNIRFTGAPVGEEGRALIMSIIMASTGKSGMEAAKVKRITEIKEKRHIKIFSSPS